MQDFRAVFVLRRSTPKEKFTFYPDTRFVTSDSRGRVVGSVAQSIDTIWVLICTILVLLMQFRPEGIMGNRELTDLFPKLKKYTNFK